MFAPSPMENDGWNAVPPTWMVAAPLFQWCVTDHVVFQTPIFTV